MAQGWIGASDPVENDRIHTHRFHPYKFFFFAEIEFIDISNPFGFALGL
jgi:hypothetical protein